MKYLWCLIVLCLAGCSREPANYRPVTIIRVHRYDADIKPGWYDYTVFEDDRGIRFTMTGRPIGEVGDKFTMDVSSGSVREVP